MAGQDIFIAWLRDAYGMEKALQQFAEHTKVHFESQPQKQSVLNQLIEDSKNHMATLEKALQTHSADNSTGKNLLAKLTAAVTGLGAGIYDDKKVKDLLVLHGALHFAHASYVSLAAGANNEENATDADTFSAIASGKESAASSVLDLIPSITVESMTMKD